MAKENYYVNGDIKSKSFTFKYGNLNNSDTHPKLVVEHFMPQLSNENSKKLYAEEFKKTNKNLEKDFELLFAHGMMKVENEGMSIAIVNSTGPGSLGAYISRNNEVSINFDTIESREKFVNKFHIQDLCYTPDGTKALYFYNDGLNPRDETVTYESFFGYSENSSKILAKRWELKPEQLLDNLMEYLASEIKCSTKHARQLDESKPLSNFRFLDSYIRNNFDLIKSKYHKIFDNNELFNKLAKIVHENTIEYATIDTYMPEKNSINLFYFKEDKSLTDEKIFQEKSVSTENPKQLVSKLLSELTPLYSSGSEHQDDTQILGNEGTDFGKEIEG